MYNYNILYFVTEVFSFFNAILTDWIIAISVTKNLTIRAWQFIIVFNLKSASTIHRSVHYISLQWCHNEHDGISNHKPHCLHTCIFKRRSKETLKLHVTGLWAGNSPVTGEFHALRASNADNFSIWRRHHITCTPWFSCVVSAWVILPLLVYLSELP